MKIIKFTRARTIAFTILLFATIVQCFVAFSVWFNMPISDDIILCWSVRILTSLTLLMGFFVIRVFLTRPSKILDNNKLW